MIDVREDVIFVVRLDGRCEPLTLEQLARQITEHPTIGKIELWVARQIAHAVLHYFHTDLDRDIVDEAALNEVLERVLECCCEVIDSDKPAAFSADLRKLAVQAGYGFELVFFKELEKTVRDLSGHPARFIQFTGLRPCVKLLTGKKNWSSSCSRLETEILDFLRRKVGNESTGKESLLVVR
jgi:hypothetical protein